jgi:hypothetical protein
MIDLKIQLLKGSQLEHDKILKDLIYVLGNDNERVKKILEERNKITEEINQLLQKQNKQ